jgi:hypothetical protein
MTLPKAARTRLSPLRHSLRSRLHDDSRVTVTVSCNLATVARTG